MRNAKRAFGMEARVEVPLTSAPYFLANSFEEFWPHYLAAHQNPLNRALHYVGSLSAVLVLGAGIVTLNPALALSALPVGYVPAWIGHFFFERNRPATFAHPLWSLRADFKMLAGALGSAASRIRGAGLASLIWS
jgi:hypothetical protein